MVMPLAAGAAGERELRVVLMAKSSQQPNPWRMAHMGLEFAGAALLLGLIGYYIDTQADTAPWGAVTGLILGVVGGMYRFIKEALAANRAYGKPQRKTDRDPEHDSERETERHEDRS